MTLVSRAGLVSIVLTLVCGWAAQVSGQTQTSVFSSVINALRQAPGCLGVETGQTSSGRRVMFQVTVIRLPSEGCSSNTRFDEPKSTSWARAVAAISWRTIW